MNKNLFDAKIVRAAEMSHLEKLSKLRPLYDSLTGERIEDLYHQGVYDTIIAMGHELATHIVRAAQNDQEIVAVFSHHLERDGERATVVAVAKIAARPKAGSKIVDVPLDSVLGKTPIEEDQP